MRGERTRHRQRELSPAKAAKEAKRKGPSHGTSEFLSPFAPLRGLRETQKKSAGPAAAIRKLLLANTIGARIKTVLEVTTRPVLPSMINDARCQSSLRDRLLAKNNFR